MVEASPDVTRHERAPLWLTVLAGLSVLVGLVFRFTTRSELWLDEALSVNIATLPLGDITEALRHDGHPPLYYVILHGWTEVFGTSRTAVRALAGVWSLLLLPLVWVAVRKPAGPVAARYALILTALSPFAVRYATETRMYAMVSVLALGGYLAARAALRDPSPARLAGVAVATGLLLWTHYWSFWFLGAAGLMLLGTVVRRTRRQPQESARAPLMVVGAIAVGGLSFLPWVSTLLHQAEHTGTPWARPMRPAEIISVTATDFGGAGTGEASTLGWFLLALAALGLVARATGPYRLELDLRTRPLARIPAGLAAGTLVLACAAGYATGAAYASRYAAVIHPFVLLLAAMGLAQVKPRYLGFLAVAGAIALSGVGLVRNVTTERTDAGRNAEAIAASASPGDLVVYCPDQLGPAMSRLVDDELEQVTYPEFAPPQRVDWFDYKDRLDATDPERFGAELLRRAEGRAIYFVYSTGYETHRATCPDLFNVIGRSRSPEVLTHATEAFEAAGVARFAPPEG